MSSLSKLRWCLCASAAIAIGLVGAAGPASAYSLGPAQNPQFGAFQAGLLSAPLNYDAVNVVNPATVTITGLVGVTAYTGEIQLHVPLPNNAGSAGWLDTWCIDIFDDLRDPGTFNTILSQPFNDNGSGHTPQIPNTALQTIGALVDYGDANSNIGNISAAVQLAIWQTEYGAANIHFSGGPSQTDINNVIAAALLMDPSYDINRLREVIDPTTRGNTNQGLVFEIAGSQVPGGTPLPPTWTMMLIGMAGIGFFAMPRTRKRRGLITA